MTILAFGGEMGFFIPATSQVIESASRYNASFARGSTKCVQNAAYAETPSVGAQTDIWVHCDLEANLSGSGVTATIMEMLDGSGVAKIRLRYTNTGTLSLEYFDGTIWVSVGAITLDINGDLQTITVHATVNSATGLLGLYVAGTLRIFDDTVDLSGTASINKLRFMGVGGGVFRDYYWSQIIIANEPTIGMRVGTIVMTGQGTTHTFTSGGFAQIDELAYSDADLINSATADQVELFTGTPVPSYTGYRIRALGVTGRVKKSGSGPTQFQFALRSAGTTYFSSTIALDFGYGAFCNVWETNPATSAAFLSSEIAALEYGVKSIA